MAVQLGAVPAITILALGRMSAFDELAETSEQVTAESISEIVKAKGPVAIFLLVV